MIKMHIKFGKPTRDNARVLQILVNILKDILKQEIVPLHALHWSVLLHIKGGSWPMRDGRPHRASLLEGPRNFRLNPVMQIF